MPPPPSGHFNEEKYCKAEYVQRRVPSSNVQVEEVGVKKVLRSSIFVVQKATAPKTGVEFCQASIGAIRTSLATSYDVWRRRSASQLYCRKIYTLTNGLTNGLTDRKVTYRARLPSLKTQTCMQEYASAVGIEPCEGI